MAREYVDFGSNLTGKLYLAKKGSSGAGDEIQVVINSYDVSGGEKKFKQKNYIGSNYSLVQEPATLVELKMNVDSNKDAYKFIQLLHGDPSGTGPYTISGGGTQSYWRLIYEVETYNASTGKTEKRRWTWENAMATVTDFKFPADDAINFDISLSCGIEDFTFEYTDDNDSAPLSTIPDYS